MKKTMVEAINEARVKGNDIMITDGDWYLEQVCMGDDWYVCGEWGWIVPNEEVEQMEVVKVEHDADGITTITVTEIDV